MLNRLNNMINPPDIPKLYLAQRVVDKMAHAALQYTDDETGEAMIGMVIDDATSGAAVYVIDTIAPGEGAVREAHTFQQGGAWQDDILHWLRENWEITRRKRAASYGNAHAARWDAPLYPVGDWHKQPGFMIQPSGGDLMTALDWVHQPGNRIGFVVAPIVTIDHPATVEDPADMENNFLRVEQPNGLMTRIDFWYIARNMLQFAPIAPRILEDRTFPRLMDYPWHLTSEARANQEIQLLEGDGMLVEILLWDTDEKLPLEVCFLTARPGASHFLLLATQHDYPHTPPDVYTLPFNSIGADEDLYDLMERIWTYAELVDVEDFEWGADKTLLEAVYVAEAALGWKDADLPTTPDGELEEQPTAEVPTGEPEAAADDAEPITAPPAEDTDTDTTTAEDDNT